MLTTMVFGHRALVILVCRLNVQNLMDEMVMSTKSPYSSVCKIHSKIANGAETTPNGTVARYAELRKQRLQLPEHGDYW